MMPRPVPPVRDGSFTVVVPVGTHGVTAESRGEAAAMTATVAVTAARTVNADLGMHTP